MLLKRRYMGIMFLTLRLNFIIYYVTYPVRVTPSKESWGLARRFLLTETLCLLGLPVFPLILGLSIFPNSADEPSAGSATGLICYITKNPFALERVDMTHRQHEKQTDCKI